MAPSHQGMEQVTSSEVDASTSAPPPAIEAVETAPEEAVQASPAMTEARPARADTATPLAFSAQDSLPLPAPEDSSFPPVDLDSHFFDGATPDADETHERDPRMVLKLGPEAARRRAQFQKYVKIAVAAASVLCLAALVKGAVARSHDDPSPHRTTATLVAPPPAPAPQPVQTTTAALEQVPAPPEQPAPAQPQATAPAGTETESAAAAPPAAPTEQAAPGAPAEAASATAEPAPSSTDGAEAPAPDPKEAAKAKRASQAALERGKLADAIEAGEHSVSLDPSDAEAWLILGAAYQEKGDQKNARRSFKSCLEQGKRGPKWECAQMPH